MKTPPMTHKKKIKREESTWEAKKTPPSTAPACKVPPTHPTKYERDCRNAFRAVRSVVENVTVMDMVKHGAVGVVARRGAGG